ncbi:MAG TPA: lysophospholipid acyltransferase family protein [Elusimicrobiota bacterium]|jgi:1-acyl-sn-glycerol-3-phosphate acyltransferase|nr:lysophospholipid acyltransferase family protein [Elusimicrobiota bacterium]
MSDFDSPFRRFCESVLYAVLRSVWGVKVTGLERVPRSGPLIVAFNHVSLVDGPLLCVAIASSRRPCFLGKQELFRVPGLGWFLRTVGMIPLQRGTADHAAMRAALEILEGGGTIGLAPEGTRVKPGETRAPKPGVGFLAAKTGARVQPARLVGAAEFPRRFPLEVRFGSPLPPPPADAGREAASSYARAVMEAIYAL